MWCPGGKGSEHFKKQEGDFPGSPVVRTLPFPCRGHGFDPWLLCFWEVKEMGLKCLRLDCWSEEGGPAKRGTVYPVRIQAVSLQWGGFTRFYWIWGAGRGGCPGKAAGRVPGVGTVCRWKWGVAGGLAQAGCAGQWR